jgi:hypothetical protein
VLQLAGVVKIPDNFANEEYAEMYFECGLCSGNGKAALVEYRNVKRIAELHIAKHQQVHGILRETCFFPRSNEQLEKNV